MAFTFNNDYSAHASDEISIFLRQLLHRSSSSSSSSSPAAQSSQFNAELSSSSAALPDTVSHLPVQSTMTIFDSDRTMVDRASAACYPLSTCWSDIPPTVCSNLTSDSQAAGAVELRSTETDADDYACDSEDEGLEEAQPNYKQNQVRNSSKRSRAAEVHNMSEKRRRSRINEKMKALQDLIPNSNKTDKASMLDEAIEYLKQLQLQVQMLSMRNGLILNPMCLPGFPGVFDPVQMEFNLSNINGTSNPTILPSGSAPPNQCNPILACAVTSINNIQGSSQRVDDTMAQHQLSITPSQANELESLISSVSSNCTSHIQLISDGLCPGTTAPDDI